MNDLSLYNQHRNKMKTGDLLTYETEGLISPIIHLWSKANHAGLVLDLQEYEGDICRRWTLEAVGTGVRMAYLSRILENVHGRVYWHALKREYSMHRNKIGCFALEYPGVTKYDFWSLLKYPFKWVSADISRLVCSEYVFLAWKSVGIVQGDYIPSPSKLETLGVTMPPVLIVESEPLPSAPVVQP